MSKVVWLPLMLKLIVVLTSVALLICIQTLPAYSGATKTVTFQVSATLPEHVISNNINTALNSSSQLVQTQTVFRNNKTISLTTIVVP